MGESSRGDDDNIPPPSNNNTSGERSKDNDNNLITSTNEKIGEPRRENDNVAPDRTTEQVEDDVNNHDRRPIGKETTEGDDRPQASTAPTHRGKHLGQQFDDTDNTSHVTVDNAEASYKDTIREQSANDEKTIQVDHDNSQSKYENKRMVGDNSSPSSERSPTYHRTNKDNASSAKTTGEQFDKCKNEDSSSPDKKTTEGDNALPAPNISSPHIRTRHSNNDSFLETESKITKHEEGNNRNKQLLEDDNESEPSNASHSHKKSTPEPSVDNDKLMCVLNNAPPSGNTTTQQQNVNDDDDNNNNNISGADLQPDGTNSTQTPRKTLQQQFLDDENNPAFATPSPRNRKSQSQKHQLRTNTGTKIKRNRPQLQHIHSLDDKIQNISDSEEESDYYNYESGAKIVFNNSSYEYCAAAHGQSLPEFVVSDENTPEIYQAPRRAAVHPNRPPFLELRPHPLRETQVGKYLRTIASTDSQLWAGLECGVRVWKLSDAFAPGIGSGGRARRGDEEAAPFYESVSTSPTMCLTIDCGSKLVWSGHKDGKIRSWNMDEELNDDPFSEGLSWQAHRGPVLALIISSYGDLWSSSEGGAIHVWPWEAIDKSLSMKIEERHMASLLVERSFINLRSQVTLNGVCNISSQDVKALLCDKVVAKVWACGTSSISLWDARTKELLKVYNIDGHIENRADTPSVQDQKVEDEMNVKLVSKSKKEKPHGFLQRSRNALKGAAGAVRRAATTSKSGGEESKLKIEAAVLASNGMIYVGCTNGLIVQWDGNGTRLQEFNHHPCAVLCFCTYGSRIWVGYVSGMVQVLDLDGNLIAGWVAHNGPIIKMVVGNGHFFSLATHGGIRGWSTASPGPIDQIIRPELSKKELSYTRRENVKILVGTWNVGEGKSSHDALMAWVGSAVSDVGIFVVGLQEVEMGAGFLAMSAAKETVGLEKSSIGNWWQDAIGKALDEGSTFERVGSRQLAGLLIAIWVRTSIRTYVGDLDVGAVACGLGRTIGNKGGVGLRLRVYDRIMCFVNCHLAAHLEAVNRRNADFSHIYRTMTFSRSSLLSNASAGVSSVAQGVRGTDTVESNPGKGKPDLAEADLVIFCGDFNYRLFGISYDDARDLVSQRSFDWLRERDQLRAEMKAGKVFQGMREAIIRFPPTYKFDKGKPGLGGYDSGEKKRIPAWCDRILYRDNRSSSTMECNLECPIVASILQYEACMDVLESDHKPVRCKLTVDIANVDRSIRRQETGKIIHSHDTISSLLHELCVIPKTDIDTTDVVLQSQETSSFKFTNRSATDKAIFQIICEGQATIQEDEQELVYKPRGAFGFPRWLEVIPASGVVGPDQVVDILVRHKDFHATEKLVEGVPQTWWSEDTCDKEALLKVVVRGNFSSETRSHTVHVRHCYSGKATQTDSSNGSGSRKYQGNTCHQSGVGHVGSQSDNDENNSLHGSEKKFK